MKEPRVLSLNKLGRIVGGSTIFIVSPGGSSPALLDALVHLRGINPDAAIAMTEGLNKSPVISVE